MKMEYVVCNYLKVEQNMSKISHNQNRNILLTLVFFQTSIDLFLLQNTKEYVLKNVMDHPFK